MRSLKPHVVAAALLFALVPVAATAQVVPGNVTNLDVPIAGGWSITPTDINDHGVVTANIGCYCGPSAMLWNKASGWTNIGGVGPYWTYPEAINNNGVVAALNLAEGTTHNAGLLWDPVNQWREMLLGPGVGTFPRDINDNGMVVGNSWQGGFSYSEAAGVTFFTGFDPVAINNAGQMAGGGPAGYYDAAVRDVNGVVRSLTSGGYSRAEDINNAGFVGGMIHTPSGWQGAVWDASGAVTTIPALGGFEDWDFGWVESASVSAINDLGQAVGTTSTPWGGFVPFVWDKVSGLREIVIPGYVGYIRPVDINNNGEVIAVIQSGHDRGLYFTVPPPVPPTPQGQTEAIADDIQALVDSGVLSATNAGSITTKLDAAIAALDRGNVTAAGNQLNSAINRVNALVNSGKLTAAQGQELRNALQAVIDGL
jgi:hypothetical protein